MKTHDRLSSRGSLTMDPRPSRDFDLGETAVAGRQAGSRARSTRRCWYPPAKQVFDFVAALVLLVLFAPLIVAAAFGTKLVSRGPALYWQTRLGLDGRPFQICKIRTMVHNAEARTGAIWSPMHDPRVTPLGRFLRRSHIDEFPQLFQVLAGHMSLVGPRPERPEFVQRLQWEVPGYLERLQVKPGVTGLAQLMLPPDADLDDVRRKVQCDLYYIRRYSLWLDLVIGLQTAWLLTKAVVQTTFAPFRLPSHGDVERLANDAERSEQPRELSLGADIV
ncbi:MAG: sugar transferase [Planctomycetaceae bacterium]